MRSNLFLPLALLVLAAGCHKNPNGGIEVDSRFTRFIPPATKALVGVRLDQLETSDFFKRHQNQLNLPQMGTLSERIGLDPTRDVSEIVLAWDGQQLLTMARGRFKSDEVTQKLVKQSSEHEKYKNLILFGDKRQSVAFLPKSLALAGPAVELKKAIDEGDSGGGGVPDDLQLRLRGVLPNAQVWGASQGVLPLTNMPLRSDMQSALANLSDYVNGTTFGIALDAGAHLKVDISCISPQGAQRVNDALRGLIGFARLSTRDNELDLLRLWDAIHVEKNEHGVLVHADLPADLADKLIDHVPGLSSGAGRGCWAVAKRLVVGHRSAPLRSRLGSGGRGSEV